MPNWCDNDLIVTGPSIDLDRFVCAGLDFNKAIPYPLEFQEKDDIAHAWEKAHPDRPWDGRPTDGYNQGGYDWCIANWGCKWNSGEGVEITRVSPKRAKATFQTPWSPPSKIADAWSRAYPSLTFSLRYYERGMGFKGHYKVKASEVLEDMHGKYSGPRGG